MNRKTSRPLFIFYILVVYVILQFAWWTFMIFELNNQLYSEKIKTAVTQEESAEASKVLRKKWMMVGGEAAVFFTLLLAGMYMVGKSLKKEALVIRQQRNFLLSVTHELKSPLASVRLQAETLKKHHLSREKQEQVIGNTLQDIDRLDQLVENILLVTRIDNPDFPVNKEQVNLSEFVNECLRSFRNLYPEANVISKIEDGIYGLTDTFLFRSVIINLLENAYKYGSKEITAELHETGGKVVLCIADRGPGIPPDEKENIFRIFYRIGNEDTRKSRGTGLGLHIVKTIVERHNGSISVNDNKPSGSLFQIKLPKQHV